MGTFVCFAAFLLAASATPIENFFNPSFQDFADDHEQGSGPESHPLPDAVSSSFTEENSDSDSDGNPDNDGNPGPSLSSSEDTSVTSTDQLPSVTPADGTSGNDVTDMPSSPSDDEDASPNATEPTPETPPSTENVTPPPDDDPNDCKFTDGERHVYLQCEFGCSGDQMERAPENATCYLNKTETTLLSHEVENGTGKIVTGVCLDGNCVPLSTGPSLSTATGETSPSISTTGTTTIISPTASPSNVALITNTSEPEIME